MSNSSCHFLNSQHFIVYLDHTQDTDRITVTSIHHLYPAMFASSNACLFVNVIQGQVYKASLARTGSVSTEITQYNHF